MGCRTGPNRPPCIAPWCIRRFEETVNELYMQGTIPSTLHLYIGQEAVATGVCAHAAARTTT